MDRVELKEFVRKKIKEKKIVLFGTDKKTEEFYKKNKDLMDIVFVVSNIKKEWGTKVFNDELNVVQYKRENISSEHYVVVCDPIAFRNLELQLSDDGLNMYEDFIESEILELLCQDKKIALFYGQCILRDIYNCLLDYKPFTDEYLPVFTQIEGGQLKVLNRVLMYVKDLCDMYVYTPKILDKDSVYSISRDELPADCKVVSISNLIMSLYWPEINSKLGYFNPYYYYPYEIKRDKIFGHTMYRHEDLNINKMVVEGIEKKEILKVLSDEDFYSEKDVKRNLNACMKLIAIAEKDVDVKIYDYINDNYKDIWLYQNYVHPNKNIIVEYINRFLEEIEIDTSGVDELRNGNVRYAHQGGDVPIYPSVIKHLGLTFISDDYKYEIMVGDGIEKMTFEEYMEHFIDYTQIAYRINGML